MDRAEIVSLWHEEQAELEERRRQREEQIERDRRLEEKKRRREVIIRVEELERRAQRARERIEHLPEIIQANKELHAKELTVLERIESITRSGKVSRSIGGDSFNSDTRRDTVVTKSISFGEITDGIEGSAEIMLFQTQRKHSLGQFILTRRLWSEPLPRKFLVRLVGKGQGQYNEFAVFHSVQNLQTSKDIVDSAPVDLTDLRMPDETERQDIDDISDLLDMLEALPEPGTNP